MYTVINHLHFTFPVDQIIDRLEKEGAPIPAALPGFQGLSFVREAMDRGVVILLWDSEQDAERGAREFGPTWFARNIAPNLATEQLRTAGAVLVQVSERPQKRG